MHTSMTNREERVKPRAGRRDAAPCLETHAFWTPGPARPQKRRLPCHRCIRQFYPGDDPLWNGCVSSVGNSSSSAWRSRERRAYRLPDEVDDLFGLSRGVASLRTEEALGADAGDDEEHLDGVLHLGRVLDRAAPDDPGPLRNLPAD